MHFKLIQLRIIPQKMKSHEIVPILCQLQKTFDQNIWSKCSDNQSRFSSNKSSSFPFSFPYFIQISRQKSQKQTCMTAVKNKKLSSLCEQRDSKSYK